MHNKHTCSRTNSKNFQYTEKRRENREIERPPACNFQPMRPKIAPKAAQRYDPAQFMVAVLASATTHDMTPAIPENYVLRENISFAPMPHDTKSQAAPCSTLFVQKGCWYNVGKGCAKAFAPIWKDPNLNVSVWHAKITHTQPEKRKKHSPGKLLFAVFDLLTLIQGGQRGQCALLYVRKSQFCTVTSMWSFSLKTTLVTLRTAPMHKGKSDTKARPSAELERRISGIEYAGLKILQVLFCLEGRGGGNAHK
jgi:hypothetical protein